MLPATAAAVAALPLVAPDIPGLDETIEHGRRALTYPVADAAAAGGQLMELLAGYAEQQAATEATREWASRTFAPAEVAPRLGTIYAEAADRRRRGNGPSR